MTRENKKDARTLLVVIGTIGLCILNFIDRIAFLPTELYFPIAFILMGLVLWGCYLWASAKNRCWAFMFWGLLSPIGLLGISLLRDKTSIEEIR